MGTSSNTSGKNKVLRMYFHFRYFLDLAKYNILFSSLGGWFGVSIGRPFTAFFLLSFVSAGFLASIGMYAYFQNDEYYFYHNKGLSKLALNISAAIANASLSAVSLLVFRALGHP